MKKDRYFINRNEVDGKGTISRSSNPGRSTIPEPTVPRFPLFPVFDSGLEMGSVPMDRGYCFGDPLPLWG